MNTITNHQRRVLVGAIGAAICALLFPPFVFRLANGRELDLGYGFLMDPPRYDRYVGTVNITVLTIELIVIALIASACWFFAPSDRRAASIEPPKTLKFPAAKSPPLPTKTKRAIVFAVIVAAILGVLIVNGNRGAPSNADGAPAMAR